MLHFAVFLATVTLASTSVVQSPSISSDDGNFELLILHNNDMHARFEQTSQLSGTCTVDDREAGKCYGGFPRVAHVVKEARRAAAANEGPPVLYLNAGDTYTGTTWFTIYKWKIAAEFINALEPDAVSLGNHEFDNGVEGAIPFIKNLTCPVLAANLDLNKVPELEEQTNLKKSVVFKINGRDVGVIGYLTPDTKTHAIKNDVEFVDEVIAIQEEANKLRENGVNIIIALGHSGYIKDQQIAKEVDGVDLVIGGHSHSLLWTGPTPDAEDALGPYPTLVTQSSGKTVPVVQAYAYTKYIGRLHLEFDSKGEIVKIDGEPMLLDNSVPQDPELLKIIDKYLAEVRAVESERVGTTLVLLDGASCDKKECNLGNLITDSIIAYYAAQYRGDHWTDAPIAMLQAGGIRTSVAHKHMPATVTKGDLLAVMPFKGALSTIDVNGTVLLEMLEHSVSAYDTPRVRQFLQMSGMKVTYNYRRPAGNRVVSAEARCAECTVPEYFEVDPNQKYKIILPLILGLGGDNYSMLSNAEALPYNELNCTDYYVRKSSPVFNAVEGRITILQSEQQNSSAIINKSTVIVFLVLIIQWFPNNNL